MGTSIIQLRNLNTINVKDFGAQGDGITDDSAAIQAAINASPNGSRVLFPSVTYLISVMIKLLPNRSYQGAAYGGTTIKQQNGANLDSLLAANSYAVNNVFSDGPIEVSNLLIDGNWSNNTSGNGLVLMNSFSIVRQVWVNNIPGAGIVLSDRSQANINTTITQAINTTGSQTVSVGSTTGMVVGMSLSVEPGAANAEAVTVTSIVDSTHITANFTKTHSNGVSLSSILMNSSIENRILECKVANANLYGIWVRDNTINPGRCTDNHIVNNVLSNCGGSGQVPTMRIERSAGHFIHRNHIYAAQGSGISCQNAWSTFITENEIDGYGQNTSATGQFWSGISVNCIGPRATVISDNIISSSEPNSSTVYQHLSVTAGGVTTGRAIVQGNHIYGGGGSASNSIGQLYQSNGTQSGSGQSFFFIIGGNRSDNVGKSLFQDGSSTTVLAATEMIGDLQIGKHIISATNVISSPSLSALSANGTSAPAPSSGSGGVTDIRGRVVFGSGTSPSAGPQVGVTFNKSYPGTPVIVLIAGNQATAALNPYVDSPSTTGFNIGCANAPAASQANNTYAVEYVVIG
jgi:hypothetical protein